MQRLSGLALGALLWSAPGAWCQEQASAPAPEHPRVEDGSDPTRPILWSIRPEIYRPADEVTRTALILRYDRAALRARRWVPGTRGVLLRFELLAAMSRVRGSDIERGLGDAYVQLLVVPHATRRFAYFAGTGLLIPTASDARLGAGKWVFAPAAGPLWFFRGGLSYVKFQHFTSVAGASSRPDLNYLLVTPVFLRMLTHRSWALLDTETKTDWNAGGHTVVKSGVQLGRGVGPRSGVWVKPEILWGHSHRGEWNLKFGLEWLRR